MTTLEPGGEQDRREESETGMNIDRLRTFVVASEELNFTQAAKRLHLSQPAVSQQIRELEDEFNVTLFPKATQPNTIHGSKAVGEPPLMLALSVFHAIRDAIAAAVGGGIPRLDAPATPERILLAIEELRVRQANDAAVRQRI